MTTWYRDGTVTLTNGSKAITGVGTEWVDFVLPGGIFFTPTGLYEVESVTSDGLMQLVTAYAGPTVSGTGYAIAPTQGYILELSRLVGVVLSDFGSLKDAWTNGAFDGWIKALDLAAATGATKVGSTEGTLQVALNARVKATALVAEDGTGADMVKTRQPYAGAVARPVRKKFTDTVSILDFGAICDGGSHPLSESFSTLLLAQAQFPFATSLTQQRDWAAAQAAVNAVRERGWKRRSGITGSQQGGSVLTPSGCAVFSDPLVLPRSGLYDGSAVGLVGEMMTASVITGTEAFPANRGLVEWEPVASRVYYQRLEKLTFILPRTVTGVNAIKFVPVDRSTTSSIFKEAMHGLCMREIEVDASNTVNAHAIKFEGYVRHSQFDVIRANFALGSNPQFNTVLLQFPEDIGTDSSIFGESNGVAYSNFSTIVGMGEQGGGGAIMRGRFYECVGHQILCGNHTINNQPSLAFIKSLGNRFTQVNIEGGTTQTPGQIVYQDSEGNTMTEIGLGAPNPGNASIGITLINSKNNHFGSRLTDPATPSFSGYGGKAVRIDFDSRGNTFENFYLNADIANEIECLAPAGACNRGDFYYPASKLRVDWGLRPGYLLAEAETNAQQSIPSGVFTQLIFGAKTRDPHTVYNAATGAITTPLAGRYRITYTAYVSGVVSAKAIDMQVSIGGVASKYVERHVTGAESFRFLRGEVIFTAGANQTLGLGVMHNFGSAALMTQFPLSASISFEYLG